MDKGPPTASSEQKAATAEASPQSSGDAHLGAPKRKTGWWEFTSGTQSGGQNLCVSDATEAVFSAFDADTRGCAKAIIDTRGKTDKSPPTTARTPAVPGDLIPYETLKETYKALHFKRNDDLYDPGEPRSVVRTASSSDSSASRRV